MPDASRIVPGAVITTIAATQGIVFVTNQRDLEEAEAVPEDPEVWFPDLGTPELGTSVVNVPITDMTEAHSLLVETPEYVQRLADLVASADRVEWYDAVTVIRAAVVIV